MTDKQGSVANELRILREYVGERGAHREFQAVEFVEAYVEAAQEELRAAGVSSDMIEARYRWLRNRVRGSEYRRLGIIYSEVEQIDEQIDSILTAAKPSNGGVGP